MNTICNICKNKNVKFVDTEWHRGIKCNFCNSQVRHRLLYEVIKLYLYKNKSILHFSPHKELSRILSNEVDNYFSSGPDQYNIMTMIDNQTNSRAQDSTFDYLILSDVLEHVEDDILALKQIFRVLKNDGKVLITIPQVDGLNITDENRASNNEEREFFYGHWDHKRIYGTDFKQRLESVGFDVKVYDHNDFSQEMVKKYVMFPPELSDKKLVTNFRKIYVGMK